MNNQINYLFFQLAVKHCEYNVIMHPVMQQLIKTKWLLFGRLGASVEFIIHLIFCIVWSVLGILLPRDGLYYGKDGINWRVPVEIFGVFLTLFFILKVRFANILLSVLFKFSLKGGDRGTTKLGPLDN